MDRRRMPEELGAQMWRRWKRGESLSEIGRAIGKRPSTIFNFLRRQGGFAPRPRVRSPHALHLHEREEISRGIASGATVREIARSLERAPSSISRELRRNGGRGGYRACRAEEAAWHRARRPKPYRLACNPRLRELVQQKLQERWSPEQISGWLASSFADDKSMRVSPETIYRSLFIQARGLLKQALVKQLRGKRPMRMPRAASTRVPPSQIMDLVRISERPPEVQDRAIPGHWEGDLLAGSRNTHIATLVERHSRFLMLVKLEGKDTHTVVNALTRHVRKLPAQLRRSLTWDRGVEMTEHKRFTLATDVQVYFCDPRSPWQRGSNENTNGLLRQYFPKGTDLSVHSQAVLDQVALQMNQRPRKTLGFATPADTLNASVAPTG
jgi:IS30 family transposase